MATGHEWSDPESNPAVITSSKHNAALAMIYLLIVPNADIPLLKPFMLVSSYFFVHLIWRPVTVAFHLVVPNFILSIVDIFKV